MDSIMSPKVMTTERKGIGACSMAFNTSKVEAHVGAPRWGLGRLTKKSITHMDLYKPNNKLVST